MVHLGVGFRRFIFQDVLPKCVRGYLDAEIRCYFIRPRRLDFVTPLDQIDCLQGEIHHLAIQHDPGVMERKEESESIPLVVGALVAGEGEQLRIIEALLDLGPADRPPPLGIGELGGGRAAQERRALLKYEPRVVNNPTALALAKTGVILNQRLKELAD